MERTIMKFVACCMIVVLLFCSFQMPVAASVFDIFSSKEQTASEQTTLTQEETMKSTMEESVEEQSTGDTEDTTELTEATEDTTVESTTAAEEITEITEDTEATTEVILPPEDTEEEVIVIDEEEAEEVTEEQMMPGLFAVSASAAMDHDITMPDMTSQYFWLQKGSESVHDAKGSHLIKLTGEKEVSQYMSSTYKNGEQYNFVPRLTSQTKIRVGGGTSGMVSKSTVEQSGDANNYGDVYRGLKSIEDTVFNLEKCKTDPYAIYTNVGTWYDKSKNQTYVIDLKLTVKNYTYPGKETRDAMKIAYPDAPYIGFTNYAIGVMSVGADTIETKMEFFYNDTTTPVENIKGMIQFIDIDAQQGVDLGDGFRDVILFDTGKTHIRYNSLGVKDDSAGYISSGTVKAFSDRDINTTAVGIFSGSSVLCVWTVARCDKKDTGGNAMFREADGYDVPVDGSAEEDNICYSRVRSTGFLGIDNDLAMISLPPQVKKNIYAGNIDVEKSGTSKTALSLADRNESFTYVVSAASETPSDIERAYYTKYTVEDMVEALLEVKDVKIYAGVKNQTEGMQFEEVTNSFNVITTEQSNHKTKVQITAKSSELKKASFYGNNYYIHIGAKIRSDEELKSRGLSIENWYQKDNGIGGRVPDTGDYRGTFAAENKAKLVVNSNMDTKTELESNDVAVKIPMRITLKKTDADSGKPVAGAVFGLFGGDASKHKKTMSPLMTATADKKGVVTWKADTFFTEKYGDGPYYIKEISVPENYKNVWNQKAMDAWSLTVPTLKSKDILQEVNHVIAEGENVINQNQALLPLTVRVIKKNTETQNVLSGAEYKLYEWSEEKQDYVELMDLTEGLENGEAYYYNEKSITNTMDNLGSYKIVESKAPAGCIITGEEWTFHITNTTKEDGSNLNFTSTKTKETQEGTLIYENPLQKGILELIKNDEEGKPLAEVTFRVTAAEDIYAPWNEKQKGAEPLVKAGEEVAVLTTDAEGKAKSEALYIGKYHVTEITGATGYVRGKDVHEVNFEYGKDDQVAEISYLLNVSNQLMKPAVNIAKLADKTTGPQGTTPNLDETTGRYLNERIAGTYQGGEAVDYKITVTNVGNVPIYQIKVTDDISKKDKNGKVLSDYIEKEQTAFVLPKNGKFVSKNGKEIKGTVSKENPLELTFDTLEVGDSVEVHITTHVKKKVTEEKNLENNVSVEASYYKKDSEEGQSDLAEVAEGLKQDADYINTTPRTPEGTVAKLADRTTGATLHSGRYEGTKTEGTYKNGDKVDFTITVSNTGNTALYNIEVTDIFSKELIKAVDMAKVKCTSGTTQSKAGKNVQIKEKGTKEEGNYCLILDTLEPEDSVELHITSVIKSEYKTAQSGLKNNVSVQAEYDVGDGTRTPVPVTEKMKDDDTVGIKVSEKEETTTEEHTSKTTKENNPQKGDSVKETTKTSSPKTGDETPLLLYLFLCLAAAGSGIYIYKKKHS